MAYDQDPDYVAALDTYNRGLSTFQTALALGHNQYWNHFANLSNVLAAIQSGAQPASAARSGSVAFVNDFLTAASPTATTTPVTTTPVTTTPVTTTPVTTVPVGTIPAGIPTGVPIRNVPTAPFLGGLLEGQIFGVDKTLLLIGGVALWFLMSDGSKKR